jgi:hypothetical protein
MSETTVLVVEDNPIKSWIKTAYQLARGTARDTMTAWELGTLPG